ncbi:acetamidase/formamidase family protein [Desulfonatronovibrio magnus]|uniref:acetamidase/formamidase family protein n=1 Tax=Desulfonatronovibrio magnus TaxID=698827 RepID=UPI0005EBCE00|nr:acetamidase/formamidase family protein [Desulfonatronovibrio magnus]
MTQKLSSQHLFYAFSAKLEPAMRVDQGQEFTLETLDCFSGQIKNQDDLLDRLDWDNVNPATGPVYINGAKPGDILGIDILNITIGKDSRVVVAPGEGVPGSLISSMETVILQHKDNVLDFRGMAEIPVNPMVGVIGVAPREREIPNGTPEKHGGNMDCKVITKGCRVYFEVEVEGALMGCGDLHAAQGDGEIGVSGAETSGEVLLKTSVYPRLKGLPTPFLETQDMVATVYSAKTADEAVTGAVNNMVMFLTRFLQISENHAAMLMSMAGDLRFCQVVDPLKTVRFEFPKKVLPALDALHS